MSVGWRRWVADHYGGRRAFLDHAVYLSHYRLGFLRSFSTVSWSLVGRLVFVCRGNICRSPYAEVIARQRFGISSASFGIETVTGVGAHPPAIHNARLREIDLTAHHATSMNDFVLRENDLLIAMEPRQAEVLRSWTDRMNRRVQVTLLGLWTTHPRPYIADPYGRSDAYFQNCFGLIDSAVERLSVYCGTLK